SGSQRAQLALLRACERPEIEGLAHEPEHALGEELMLLEAHDARMTVEYDLEECRARAWKADQQDVVGRAAAVQRGATAVHAAVSERLYSSRPVPAAKRRWMCRKDSLQAL